MLRPNENGLDEADETNVEIRSKDIDTHIEASDQCFSEQSQTCKCYSEAVADSLKVRSQRMQ